MAEVNCQRKVKSADADIKQAKEKLEKLCNSYMDILLKHITAIGKTDLVQMSLQTKGSMRHLYQMLYTLPIWHHVWLWQELTNLERAGIISSSTSSFSSTFIIVPKKKDLTTKEISIQWWLTSRRLSISLILSWEWIEFSLNCIMENCFQPLTSDEAIKTSW